MTFFYFLDKLLIVLNMLFFLNLVQNNIIVPEPVGGTPFYHAVYAHVAHEYIYTA